MIKSDPVKFYPSITRIKVNQFARFIKVGVFLHVMAFIGLMIFYFGLKYSIFFFQNEIISFGYLWLFISAWGLTIPFFAEFDAKGRYENYKQVKDSLFKMGYDVRLIKPFMYSKCQRDAVLVAAKDLDCKQEVQNYYYKNGYRWYHILPDAFVRNPLVLFRKIFWTKILFTKHYQLKNFYW